MNIYIELEITPTIKDEKSIIDAANKKIKEWNSFVNHPKKKLLVKEKVKLYKDIISKIKEPGVIEQHASEYKAIKKQERITQEKELREEASLLTANGEIESNHLTKLKQKYTAYTEKEILSILGVSIKKEKEFKYKEDNIPEIERSIMSQIETNLTTVVKANLYDFLGVSKTSSSQEIEIQRVCIYKTNSENINKDAVNTATGFLCGCCKDLLLNTANPQKRKSYDKSVENSIFKDVKEKITTLTSSTKHITTEQYLILLQECAKRGIAKDKSEYYIYRFAKESKATILEGDNNSLKDVVSCRICSALNSKSSKVCKSCAFPIVVQCPQCDKISSDYNELKCTKCGFSIGDMPNANIEIIQIEKALLTNDIKSAENHFLRAESLWKTHPSLFAIKQKITTKLSKRESIKRDIVKLHKSKSFVTIQPMLYNIEIGDNELVVIKRETDQAIASAEALFSRGATISDVNKRIDLCMQILTICSDYTQAKKEIQMNPPLPPSILKVESQGKTIRLNWSKQSSSYITNRIIRKKNGRPTNYNDGEIIAETNDCKFDDTTTEIGVSYYYAIYSQCADIYSSKSTISEPIMTIDEINQKFIVCDIQETYISFNYKLPSNAVKADIYRDNTLIKTVSGGSFTDNGLISDKNYTYRFIVLYEDCIGTIYRSNGITLSLKPTSPPKSIELKKRDRADKFELYWLKPTKGILEIYFAYKPFSYNKNDIISLDSLNASKILFSGNSTIINKDFSGERYYIAIVSQGNVGVISNQIVVQSIANLDNIDFHRNENQINVSWEWGQSELVRIIHQVDNGNEHKNDITKVATPKFNISIPQNAKYIKVKVASAIKTAIGEIALSKFTEKEYSLELIKISFLEVKGGGFFSRNKYKLSLKSDSIIPCDLYVLIGEGATPNDLVNFKPYLTVKKTSVNIGQVYEEEFTYTRVNKNKPLIFRIILANRNLKNSILIIPEAKQIK